MTDASQPSPRSGENVSDVPFYYQETLQSVAAGQFDLLRDHISEAQDLAEADGDEFERAELLREVRDIQAELEIVATLLEHYPEEAEG